MGAILPRYFQATNASAGNTPTKLDAARYVRRGGGAERRPRAIRIFFIMTASFLRPPSVQFACLCSGRRLQDWKQHELVDEMRGR